jgi:hypothetical protein
MTDMKTRATSACCLASVFDTLGPFDGTGSRLRTFKAGQPVLRIHRHRFEVQVADVWLVLQWRGEQVEVQGIFDALDKAVATCKTDQYLVCPLTMNKALPDEKVIGEEYVASFFPCRTKG